MFDRIKRVGKILFEAASRFVDHRCLTLAAALAFFALFSLAPALVVTIAAGGQLFGEAAVRDQLFEQLSNVMSEEAAESIQSLVLSASESRLSTHATWISIVGIVIGASAMFTELRAAVNTIISVTVGNPQQVAILSSILDFLRSRLISFVLVVGLGFLLIASLSVEATLSILSDWLQRWVEIPFATAKWLERTFSMLTLTIGFTTLLKILPKHEIQWRSALWGGVTAAVLLVAGKSAFEGYLREFGAQDIFGAAGSVAIVLLWLYYCAVAFLFGAEVAAEVEWEARRDPART